MKTEELKTNFSKAVLFWENELHNYSGELFSIKESEESWSIGQVYQHLVELTGNIFRLIEKLNATNDNSSEEKTETGVLVFSINQLGGRKFSAPASLQFPVQPQNKEDIKKDLADLKEKFDQLYETTLKTSFKGKYKHPFLGFLSAMEWLQFTEMHLRHHILQKERIDEFIAGSKKTSGQ